MLFLAVVGGGLYYYYSTHVRGVQLGGKALKGTLYLTLNPLTDPAKVDIYTFDLSNKALKPLLRNDRQNLTIGLSTDGSKMVYASREKGESAYQLYGRNTFSSTNDFQLTDDLNKFKREPVLSSDNSHVVYSVQPVAAASSTPNLALPNSWLIFITDLAKNIKLVGVGTNPFFSPDGATLYMLQNDGIHGVMLSDIKAATLKNPLMAKQMPLALPLPQGVSLARKSMKISISADGTRLAWSVPDQGVVHIYTVSSWSPLTMTPEKDIPATAYFTAFSPDGQYLALQEENIDAAGQTTNPKITIYNLADGQKVQALDLDKYSTKYLWLSAWR